MVRKIWILLPVILVVVPILAQETSEPRSVFDASEFSLKPEGFLRNLIDPAKFDMSQSYSLSVLSTGKQSMNQGMYLNTMTYRFSDPLLMQLRVGYLHQPFGGNNSLMPSQQGSLFIQGAYLQYKPMENMTISIDYQSYPSSILSPYWGRW
ncbi:hypothetical protein JW948_04980 [bacterium]|nr:hypothetical protein [bacterium]